MYGFLDYFKFHSAVTAIHKSQKTRVAFNDCEKQTDSGSVMINLISKLECFFKGV